MCIYIYIYTHIYTHLLIYPFIHLSIYLSIQRRRRRRGGRTTWTTRDIGTPSLPGRKMGQAGPAVFTARRLPSAAGASHLRARRIIRSAAWLLVRLESLEPATPICPPVIPWCAPVAAPPDPLSPPRRPGALCNPSNVPRHNQRQAAPRGVLDAPGCSCLARGELATSGHTESVLYVRVTTYWMAAFEIGVRKSALGIWRALGKAPL